MNFSKIFIDRPIATCMIMLAIIMLGAAAYPRLAVSALPRVDFPTIQVFANYPGASPDTMAALVATPLERQFAQVPGITEMSSNSGSGSTSLTLQFELGRDLDGAAQDVQSAISGAGGQLPRDLPAPPSYRKVNPSDTPILILAVTSDTLPLTAVDDAADTILAQQISQVNGVGRVNIGGEQKPAIRLELSPDKLSATGLSFEDVRTAVAGASTQKPKGTLRDSHQTFTIDANDQLLKPEAYNDIVIATHNNAPVRVSDVGQAMAGPENTQLAAWYNQHHAVLLIVNRQPGADVIATADAINAMLPALEASLPHGIEVHTVIDRTKTIRASVHEVRFTLLLSILLVVAVIFVFLRDIWGTIIPTVAVPIAAIGTFAIMYMLDYSIDNLSLMGLTIAVGFVVDDAIVMVENIERHVSEGLNPYDAAVKGSAEIGFTIISISISLIAVFIPLFLMSGYVGELFREFAVTVAASVLVSLLVSLTLTPLLSARLLTHTKREHGRLYTLFERFFDWMLETYTRGLKWVLAHQGFMLGVAGGTVVLTVVMFLMLPKGFFPEQDVSFMNGTLDAAPNISFVDMAAKQAAIDDILMRDPAIESVASFVGSSGSAGALNSGRMMISLKPLSERDGVKDVIARLRPKLSQVPGTNTFLSSVQDIRVGGRQSKSLYQYTLSDNNQAEMNTWAPKVMAKLRTIDGLTDVTSDQDELMPQITININRDAASRLGITPSAIDDTLNDAFGQRQVATIFSSINQYHVVMSADSRLPLGPEALQKIYVKSAAGDLVPLNAVATLERTTAPPSVNHQGSFPSVTYSFNLNPGMALGQAVDAINAAMTEMGAPSSLHAGFQGTAQAFQSSLASEPLLVLAALVAIYVVLAILYESLIHPLTILSTLPSAGVGALLTLFIFRQEFTVMALIGVILLMGIVKKNGIMLVDFALEGERKQGLDPEKAIYEACLKRFRPIMMTTMAAMFTGVPLAIGFGDGAELRQPLGLTIVGGLLFSQALTLFTTPVIYLALERLRMRTVAYYKSRFGGGSHDQRGDRGHSRPHAGSPLLPGGGPAQVGALAARKADVE